MIFRLSVVCLLAGLAACTAKAPAPSDVDRVLSRWDADDHPDLKAVIVLRNGALAGSRYYNGEKPDTLHDIRSAGKSITSLLVGMAIEAGRIEGTSDPVGRYLPDARGTPVENITLDDALTMRSGLDADDEDEASPGNEDKLDAARDPRAFALSISAREPRGSRYVYNSLSAYLVGLVVEKAVGRPQDEFARDALFSPLGITHWTWQHDAGGHTKGQGNLWLTALDVAKIGQMVLDGGTYQGRRIVGARWLDASVQPRVAISAVDPYADGYGYFWYTKTHDIRGERVRVSFASGSGGNKIYIVPSRHLVVAITSSAYGRGYGQRRSEAILRALLEEASSLKW
ncbi:beta-lactamase family protein [Pendulispora rubella]|uniref:Beta-lactamase family protein n=1 Tax=Pendulispora rubella TaxID=2741070 RepID=A0ABZ2KP30_9BACT